MDTNSKKVKFINLITNIKKGSTDLIGVYLTRVLKMNHSDMEYLKQLIGVKYQYYMKTGVFPLTTNIKQKMQKLLRKPMSKSVKIVMKKEKQNTKN